MSAQPQDRRIAQIRPTSAVGLEIVTVGSTLLRFAGSLSSETCIEATQRVVAFLDDLASERTKPERLGLDLGTVSFIDARGVTCLLEIRRAADERGVELVAEAMSAAVGRVLEICRLVDANGWIRDVS